MLVSIIIPVYKVEQYISRCAESVLNQTYRQLEIIFVDDCSSDESIVVVKDYISNSPKSQDLKFRFLAHDHNMGLSAARNTGISSASGQYVYFLDSDDEISPDCIETLVEASEDGQFDVVCGALKLCGSTELFTTELSFYEQSYLNNNDVLNAFVRNRIPIAAWNKLIRRETIFKEGLCFKRGLIYEDNLWTFELMHCVKSLKTLTKQTYHYWIHPCSIMTSTYHLKKYEYLLVVFAERERFLKDRGLSNSITNRFLIKNKAMWAQCMICDNHLTYKERQHLFSSVLALSNSTSVFIYSLAYYFRWVLHQMKCFLLNKKV